MEKRAFPLRLGGTGKTDVVISQTPKQTCVITAPHYNQIMQLGNAFTERLPDKKDVLGVGNADKSLPLATKRYLGSLRHPAVPSHSQASSVGRTGIIALFRLCLYKYVSGLVLPFLKVSDCGRRSPSLQGELRICQWASSLNPPLNEAAGST